MAKQYKWTHIFWWLGLYLFWILVFQNRAFAFSKTLTVQFCYLIFIAANYYFNFYFNIPVFLYRKRYLVFAACMLAGILLTALLRVPLATYLNAKYFMAGKMQPDAATLFFSSFLNIFIWVVCIVAAKLILDRFRFQQYVDEMEKEKTRTELDFLNAQFNPHFLFNSINSIYGHIDKQNGVARNMLLTFSDMLRYQLYDCNTDKIGIDKELGYIKNYVLMQQSRKEESLSVNLSVDETVTGFSVAPLLFIAFIENAFKFVGNGEDTQNSISISFTKRGEELVFRCINTKEPKTDTGIPHKGIGITNARRRLNLLYPDAHQLQTVETEGEYEVILKLKLA